MNSRTSGLNTHFKLFCVMPLILPVLLVLCSKTISTEPVNSVLRGSVAVEKDLPEEFYGTWSVISVLEDTNNPELFRKKSSDIWTFQRNGDTITLSNPVNRASASITVNEVKDKTATFTRLKKEDDYMETETPEITVEGDSFYGTDTIIMHYFENGRRVKTDVVKYKVTGRKLTGPALKDIFAE